MTSDMGYAYDVDLVTDDSSAPPLIVPSLTPATTTAAATTTTNTSTHHHRAMTAPEEIGFKFRNAVSQFSDIFSEFNRYIAPAYHHDRCERSVQMKLYSMNKREFAMVFIAFFGLYACAVIIGVAGPPITATMHRSARHDLRLDVITATSNPNVNNDSASPSGNMGESSEHHISHGPDEGINSTGPFLLRTPYLSSYNRQLWLLAKIRIRNRPEETFQTHFRAIVDIKGLIGGNETESIFGPNSIHNRSKLLNCKEGKCDEFNLAHLGFLHFSHYAIKVAFSGLEKYDLKDVIFYFKSYNPAFTQLELWFRIIFLVCAAVILLCFQRSLRRHPKRDWSMEQKWIFFLLPLLMLYNNPLFFLVLISDSVLPSAFDSFFQATFLCALLFFWLCAYHGLRQTKRTFKSFYLFKLLLVGPVWVCSVFLSIWERANQLRDPTFSEDIDTAGYNGLKIFFFIMGALYILTLMHHIARTYSDLRSMPYFDMRLKFLTVLMLVVLSVSIAVVVLRFGVGVLEDHFVSQLSTTYRNSAEFMSFYGLLNLYLYTMAFVYSPADVPQHESGLIKDNPSFSMMNESDEDVLFGSDDDARRPLYDFSHEAELTD